MKGMEAAMHPLALAVEEEKLTREKRRRAARVVAANARDAQDCVFLLGALGLDAREALAPERVAS